MCGIAGIYHQNPKRRKQALECALKAISHRGPNHQGEEDFAPQAELSFGMRRLAIVDTSESGNQPKSSKHLSLIYNGEIYNFKQVKKELIQRGYQFTSNTDTEVLLYAIEEYGVEHALRKANGMFAFALWNKKDQSLTLGRDRMGIKPLYYGWNYCHEYGTSFGFSSELSGIENLFENTSNNSLEINQEALGNYLGFRYTPEPLSIYKGVFMLPPASVLKLTIKNLKNKPSFSPHQDSSTFSPKSYWQEIIGSRKELDLEYHTAKKRVSKLLKESIKLRLMSDVPLGLFISGGIDSTLLLAYMKELKNEIDTFCISFEDAQYDESINAREVAKYFGSNHHTISISNSELVEVCHKLPQIMSEPFANPAAIPSYILSKFASKSVTVALSGNGADEVFLGYNRYLKIEAVSSYFQNIPLKLRQKIGEALQNHSNFLNKKLVRDILIPFIDKPSVKLEKLGKVLGFSSKDELYLWLCLTDINPNQYLKNKDIPKVHFLYDKIFNDPSLASFSNEQKYAYLDRKTYLNGDLLRMLDRTSMATSLEARVPFLDHTLVEYASKLPKDIMLKGGAGKSLLKDLLRSELPKNLQNLVSKPKKGFSVPISSWLRGELRDFTETQLNSNTAKEYLDIDNIRSAWSEHLNGSNNGDLIWSALMFSAWLEGKKDRLENKGL